MVLTSKGESEEANDGGSAHIVRLKYSLASYWVDRECFSGSSAVKNEYDVYESAVVVFEDGSPPPPERTYLCPSRTSH